MTEENEKKKTELIIESGGAKIKIATDKLADALDKIVTDPKIREDLENKPLETLAELGIDIDDEKRAALTGKRLSEAIAEETRIAAETEKFKDKLFAGAPWTMVSAAAYPYTACMPRTCPIVIQRNITFVRPQQVTIIRPDTQTRVGVRIGVSVCVFEPIDEKIQGTLREAVDAQKALRKAIKDEEEKAKK